MKLSAAAGATMYIFVICSVTTACVGGSAAASESESLAVAHRYTRLNAAGRILGDEISGARCVRDSQTGLLWELKTDDGGVHDKDNSYRWGGIGAEGIGAEAVGPLVFDDWNQLVNATNEENLCGFDDWRVPTIAELKSLVVAQQTGPTINTDFFPLTLAAPYWSASGYQGYPEHGQNVHFGSGDAYYYNGYRGNSLAVRLVRSTK